VQIGNNFHSHFFLREKNGQQKHPTVNQLGKKWEKNGAAHSIRKHLFSFYFSFLTFVVG
jgi:hypothetical protein